MRPFLIYLLIEKGNIRELRNNIINIANLSSNDKEDILRECLHNVDEVQKYIYLRLGASSRKPIIDNDNSIEVTGPEIKQKGECNNRISNHMNLTVHKKTNLSKF